MHDVEEHPDAIAIRTAVYEDMILKVFKAVFKEQRVHGRVMPIGSIEFINNAASLADRAIQAMCLSSLISSKTRIGLHEARKKHLGWSGKVSEEVLAVAWKSRDESMHVQ